MTEEELRDLRKQVDEVVNTYFKELISLRLEHKEILDRFQNQLSKKEENIIKKNLNI